MTLNLSDPSLIQTDGLIGGKWRPSRSGKTYAVSNPATGETIVKTAYCDGTDCALAIDAAVTAFPKWAALPAKQRSAILMAWYELLVANKADLARLLVAEQGKPLAEAEGEILYGASYVQWFAEEAKRIYGDVLASPSSSVRLMNIKQPVGVVACITPWNFPNAMLTRKLAPALAAGCTVVCKPASETPLSAHALGELAIRAGVPPGVINIVSGNTKAIGCLLTSDPRVRKLTFTGSTAVGKKLTADCAATLKRTSMELGGNAPFIVFESADIDAAVAGLVANKFRNAGQTCVCTNRVFVQSSVLDVFKDKLVDAVSKLSVGNGLDEATTIGPLITRKAKDHVLELVEDARAAGAKIISPLEDAAADSNFLSPIVIVGAGRDMRIFSEEIFGPVAPLFAFETEAEAIALSNDTPFGLAAYFYSQDFGQIFRVSEQLEVGMVGVNQPSVSSEMIPFGGIKESGQGREGSRYGLDDYLEIKHINIGGIDHG